MSNAQSNVECLDGMQDDVESLGLVVSALGLNEHAISQLTLLKVLFFFLLTFFYTSIRLSRLGTPSSLSSSRAATS